VRANPEIGAVIADRYVLRERIGAGGMGVVYRASQPSLSRTVAIKLLQPAHADDAGFRRRFHAEAIAASRVSHPNSVMVLEHGETADGTPFIAMEDIEGTNLGKILARDGTLPPRRAIDIVGQLLAALGEAHASGVIHGDVKTDNLVVETTRQGDRVRLIDFGLARLADDSEPEDPGRAEVSGTPEYMAPEVVSGGAPGPVSDLYSAGVVLYELLVGETPFAGGSVGAVMRRHLHDEVVPPSLRSPDRGISAALERVVLRALAKAPAARFASAAAFEAALRDALASMSEVLVRPRDTDGAAAAGDRPTIPWTPVPGRLARASNAPDDDAHARAA
jgi:serine/threonine-protein kinase